MSGAAQGSANTNKAIVQDPKDNGPTVAEETKNAPAALEEDDEFEDFPVEDWTQDETDMPGSNVHLWEESWDDDDTSDDFSAQLKEELKKVEKKG